jgi:hypothetical protein
MATVPITVATTRAGPVEATAITALEMVPMAPAFNPLLSAVATVYFFSSVNKNTSDNCYQPQNEYQRYQTLFINKQYPLGLP